MEETSQFMQAYDSHRKSHFFLPKATKFLLYGVAGLGLFMLFVFTTESLDVDRLQAYAANVSTADVTNIAIQVHAIQEEATEVHIETSTVASHNGNRRFMAYCQNENSGVLDDNLNPNPNVTNKDDQGKWFDEDTTSGGTIVGQGCGLCATAMVLAYHTQNFTDYTPRTINAMCRRAGLQCPSASTDTITQLFNNDSCYADVGLRSTYHGTGDKMTKTKMDEVLDQGGYIIINKKCTNGAHACNNQHNPDDDDKCGIFCTINSAGHYICIYQHNEDDTYYVGNSNGSCAAHYEFKFSATNLVQTDEGCIGYWYAILPTGGGSNN